MTPSVRQTRSSRPARTRPITGTHVYGMFKCARSVALEFHGDRESRRAWREEEEFVLQRGRDHEARFVAELGWPEPEYPERDWSAGAAATLDLLRDGVDGVSQGVLLGTDRLGIPDLLRREAGASALGADHHYVIGDVKTSGRPRGDQILQVVFYSRLLEAAQERRPSYGYLVLKDGREERFAIDDYLPVLDELEERVLAIRDGDVVEAPFLDRACDGCRWSTVCLPELESADDLSLLAGMTRGVRATLSAAGCPTAGDLATGDAERLARASGLDLALILRLQRAARARGDGIALREPRARLQPLDPAAFVHFLTDAYEDRVLAMGVLAPATPDGEVHVEVPADRADEWRAFGALLRRLPARAALLHYGGVVPRWYDERSSGRLADLGAERRFVDFARRLRGAAVYPGPVFGIDGHVEHGLGRDPHRVGRAAGAALRGRAPAGDGDRWLREKLRADLEDLAALRAQFAID